MTDTNHGNWEDEEKPPQMVVMPSGGGVAAAVTRTLMNLAVLLFMLAVVGLAVASFFIRERFAMEYEAERRLTPAAVAEVVEYAADMECAREALTNYQFAPLRGGGERAEPVEGCDYSSTVPIPPPPTNTSAGVPTRVVVPLPPDRPNLQVRIDTLLQENARLRRPPPAPPSGGGGGGGLPGG